MKKRFLAWITAALLVIMTIVPPTVFAESEGMSESEIENEFVNETETEFASVENENGVDNEETESDDVIGISDNLTVSATYTEEAEEAVADEEVFALVDAESSTESVELLTVEETESMTVEDRQDEEAEEVQAQDADESVTVDNEEAASEPDEEQEIAEEAPEDLAEELPVIVDEKAVSASWINAALGMSGSLSGNWGKDMLAIARTQVGYREN